MKTIKQIDLDGCAKFIGANSKDKLTRKGLTQFHRK
jgi:hypothetical protein